MGKLSEEFIAQLKSANDIVDMFRTYTDVKKSGRLYTCCCPFHAEKTPSCMIYPENNSFYCFGCGAGGDVIKFVSLIENVSYMEAIKTLAQRCGMEVPSPDPKEQQFAHSKDRCLEINRETANFYYQYLLKSQDRQGLQYLKNYQVAPETVRKFAVGYAPEQWHLLHNHLIKKGFSDREILTAGVCRENQNHQLYDYFRDRLIFPIIDFRGNVTAFSGRALQQNQPLFLTTEKTIVSENQLFALQIARNAPHAETMILAEDCFNAVVLHQAGFENTVALCDITFHNWQVQALAQYAKEVILIFSNASHYQNIGQIRNTFSDENISVRVLNLQNAFDSADFIRNYGTEQFRQLLERAGDAVNMALENAVQQEESEEEKIQNAVKILSQITNPLEREIYISSTAEKLQIKKERLQSAFPQKYKKNQNPGNSIHLTTEELFGTEEPNRKKRMSGDSVLLYLLKNPEELPGIQKQLVPEQFVTEFQRTIYSLMCTVGAEPENVRQGLSPEYAGKLDRFLQSEIPVSWEITEDCMKNLQI